MINTDWNVNEYRKQNDLYGGVGYYRVIKPKQYLESEYGYKIDRAGATFQEQIDLSSVESVKQSYRDIVSKYDLVISKPIDNQLPATLLSLTCQELGVPLIVDLDDNHFEVKEDNPAYLQGYGPGGEKRQILGAFISFADALFVSTKPLADYYKKFLKEALTIEKPVFVLPNSNDFDDWQVKTPEHKEKEDIVIGWMGSVTHDEDLAMVIPAIKTVLEKYPKVKFNVVGGLREETIHKLLPEDGEWMNRFLATGPTQAWDKYPELVANLDFDIGICPLVNDEFTKGKSHIKWMEYTMAGIPVVVSDSYPYTKPILRKQVVQDGKTGLVAKTTQEWVDHLSRLIEDHELRTELATNAQESIKKSWQYKDNIKLWQKAIEEVLE